MRNISIENSLQKGCSSSHLRPDQPLLGLEDSQGTDYSPSAPWGASVPFSSALTGDRTGCDCVYWVTLGMVQLSTNQHLVSHGADKAPLSEPHTLVCWVSELGR